MKGETGASNDSDERLVLRLFVAGDGPNSVAARANLKRLLESRNPSTYSVEIVDCLVDPLRAIEEGVLVTPTLLRLSPPPRRTVVGSLSESSQVGSALDVVSNVEYPGERLTLLMRDGNSTSKSASIEELIARLSATERELQQLGAGELDAVVDPTSATAILLKNAQVAISQSEARFRDLVNRCPALVCEVNENGETIFANAAVQGILGFATEEIVGQSWSSLVPEEDRNSARELAAAVQRGDVTSFELPLRTRSGDVRCLLFNTANRYAAGGELQMVVAFGIDITERRRAEESAKRLAAAERARSEAEAANKAKTDFLAVMSHELRTPLNAIAGYAELIEMGLRGPVTAAQADDLAKIKRSQRHLLGLINDIMNFARLETGHVSIALKDIYVNETLAVLDALTEPQVAAKGIAYVKARCEPGLTAWADEEKTRQILINLVSNAIKFTPEGGRITISCDADDATIRFQVTDTGRGIAAEKLEMIFEPFVQVNKQFTRDEGVGLGLAISRDLARMMRGELTAESVFGSGSVFTLTLPRSAADAQS